MLDAIVEQVAALAERLEVLRTVVGRVVVKMRGSQDDLGGERVDKVSINKSRERATFRATPDVARVIPPAAIAEMPDDLTMRSAAGLTSALRALEPDHRRELRPI